ncbi:MAG: FadR family transcriptional regulator [Planctomycetes bacterium]|nr:FadR family transcriptional regulator [Planctomycetota bacterium]
MSTTRTSTTEWLYTQMLARIQAGDWPVGSSIPSERTLMEEFGVSRVPLRESLSMLRALGVLDIGHGRCAVVRRIDAGVLGHLFPLMLSMEGQQTFQQVFEVRLALEFRTAYLAALRRTEDDMRRIELLLAQFREQVESGSPDAIDTDLEFHVQIAAAAKNPLFPLLLRSLAGFVKYVARESCRGDLVRLRRAVQAHESITEAIRWKDAERARVEMEAHLHYSANRIIRESLANEPSAESVPCRIRAI